ncbi:diphthamide synthesis protein [Candidatus Woesearchaeota archaeon]|nr:diphthamide synthesis protein [Candidatus Woesearchaeota archaeon]
MDTLIIDARWEKPIKLPQQLIRQFKKKKVKTIALFASVQFLALEPVIRQLHENSIEVLATKAKRTHVPVQILGCDAYHDTFADDIITQADVLLYIGDGLFHPKALLLAQSSQSTKKEVIIWDPVSAKTQILTPAFILQQERKRYANLKKFLAAQTIGVLISLKPGQQYLPLAKRLKENLEQEGKKVYLFLDNTFVFQHCENYPFIDCWVNTACPRIGMDDITTLPVPLVNIREALDPIPALEGLSLKRV